MSPLLLPGLFALVHAATTGAAPQQPSAVLDEVHGRRGFMPLAQLIGTLAPLAQRDTTNGVSIALYAVDAKMGECAHSSDAPAGADARLSTPELADLHRPGTGGRSQFRLYKTTPRLDWRLVGHCG
jgi:hypothetical protein